MPPRDSRQRCSSRTAVVRAVVTQVLGHSGQSSVSAGRFGVVRTFLATSEGPLFCVRAPDAVPVSRRSGKREAGSPDGAPRGPPQRAAFETSTENHHNHHLAQLSSLRRCVTGPCRDMGDTPSNVGGIDEAHLRLLLLTAVNNVALLVDLEKYDGGQLHSWPLDYWETFAMVTRNSASMRLPKIDPDQITACNKICGSNCGALAQIW